MKIFKICIINSIEKAFKRVQVQNIVLYSLSMVFFVFILKLYSDSIETVSSRIRISVNLIFFFSFYFSWTVVWLLGFLLLKFYHIFYSFYLSVFIFSLILSIFELKRSRFSIGSPLILQTEFGVALEPTICFLRIPRIFS